MLIKVPQNILAKTKSVAELASKGELNPFVEFLFSLEPRIRVHSFELIEGSYKMSKDREHKQAIFYAVSKDHIHIPYSFPDEAHEVAHMVEMRDPSRWTLPDWGLKLDGNLESIDRQVFAWMAREVRVRAIQLHMMGADKPKISHPTLYNILNNGCWKDSAQRNLSYGRFKTMKDVEDWVLDLREKTFNDWSKDRIITEWVKRLDYIRDEMESASHSTQAVA
jgi:hypothetical protein